MVWMHALKIQTYLARAFRQRSNSSMIGVAATVKDNLVHAPLFSALGDQFAYLTRQRDFAIMRNRRQRLYRRPGRAFLGRRKHCPGLLNGPAFSRAPFLLLSSPGRSLRAPALRRGSRGNHLCGRLGLFFRLRAGLWLLRWGRAHCWLEVAQTHIERGSGGQRVACAIIDDLCVDMLPAAKNIQARTRR